MSSRSVERQPVGIAGLDEVLGGGLPSHRLYVTEGNPGSGKTTLAIQFLMEGVRQGQKCMYITLSETLDELTDVAESHGWSLEGIDVLELDKITQRLQDDSTYSVYHASDVELVETLQRIRAEVQRVDPDRLVLDSVSELKILSQTAVRYRREILGLKQFFAGRKCTVMILDDLTALEGEQQLQSVAHGVIRMEREAREYGTTRRQLHIVKLRGVQFQDGHHDFIIERGGIRVHPRLWAARASTAPEEGVAKSGNERLDALLGGGIDRGSSVLVMGPAGAGKTTLASQYAAAALERGERVATYLFEETRDTFLTRSKGVGMDFTGHIEAGRFELVQVDIAELSPGEFASRVRRAVEWEGARLIVIDSMNGYLNGMPSERYLLIHMHELLTYLGQKGVATILTLAQHGVVGRNMQTPVDVSFLADTVVLLRYFEAMGTVRQAVSVVKKRRGQHERTIRELRIGSAGLQIGDVLANFQGVLSGVPQYFGSSKELIGEDD